MSERAGRIPLSRSPLVLALVQVRFSPSPELVDDDHESQLAGALPGFPVRRPRDVMALPFPMPPEVVPMSKERVYESVDGLSGATVAQDFVATHVTRYPGRAEFLTQVGTVLSAVERVYRPPLVTRVGVRYIDRVDADGTERALSRDSIRGALDDAPQGMSVHAQVMSVEMSADDDKIAARSLWLPANATHDPVVAPTDKPTWVLDIDAFTEGRLAYSATDLVGIADRLADRAYAAFEWAVTDTFFQRFI